jgi:hypothetical protein
MVIVVFLFNGCTPSSEVASSAAAKSIITQPVAPWKHDILATVDHARALLEERAEIATRLDKLGSPPEMGDEFLKWLPTHKDYLRLRRKQRDIDVHINDSLLRLWGLTAHPTNIPEIPIGQLRLHAENLLAGYGALVDKSKSLEELVKTGIPETVASAKGDYAFVAMQVLQRWATFSPAGQPVWIIDRSPPARAGDIAYAHISTASAASIQRGLRQWYASAQDDLIWDASKQRFVPDKDEYFQFPDVNLELQLQ